MNLFFRELKATRKSLIIWLVSISFFIAAGMSKFAAMADQGEALKKLMESMPEALLSGLGMDQIDFTQVLDFYAYCFAYILLVAGIYAMRLGLTILTKEEADKTVEFLATKPIRRAEIVTGKIAASIVNILIFCLVTFLVSWGMIEAVSQDSYDTARLLMHIPSLIVFMLLFLMLGLAVSVWQKNLRKTTTISLGTVFSMYILSILSGLSDNLEFIKYLTPFKYFESLTIVKQGMPSAIYFIICLLISILCVGYTYKLYEKKEFTA